MKPLAGYAALFVAIHTPPLIHRINDAVGTTGFGFVLFHTLIYSVFGKY